MNYSGIECPICKQKLTTADDIVVCPECGAPYHRACYKENGSCLFESRHAEGFEFKLPAKPAENPAEAASSRDNQSVHNYNHISVNTQEASSSTNETSGHADEASSAHIKGIICNNCSTINTSSNIFCEHCGQPLRANEIPPQAFPFGVNMGANLNGSIDDVSKADLHTYIGPSADLYLYRMQQQQTNNSKTSFMASPLLFSPFYFAYRKMWGWAAISGILSLLFSIPALLIILREGGSPVLESISSVFLEYLRFIVDIVNLACQICFALFALHLYKKHSIAKIKALRAEFTDDAAYQENLVKNGGTSYAGVAVVFLILLVFSFILSYFFSDSLSAYLQAMLY